MEKLFSRHLSLFLLLLLALSIALHWRVFSFDIAGLHCMRQAQTQQNIQNFYRYDSNILNPRINVMSHEAERPLYRYEFPIMQWSVAMLFRLTGESVLVTRIVLFLVGLGSVGGMFFLLKQLFSSDFTAWAGAWAFSFSPVFFCYTMNPMPDNLALCGAIWSLAYFFKFLKSGSLWDAAGSAFFLSLGIAAKLPFVLFLAAPGWWLIRAIWQKRFENIGLEIRFALIFTALLFPTILWYAWVVPTWNNGVVAGIFDHPISWKETMDTLRFHRQEMFPRRLLGYGSVPFFLLGIFFTWKNKAWKDNRFPFLTAVAISVLAYWIFEFNMIGKVHDYYMMPFLPVLFVLVAYGFHGLTSLGKWAQWLSIALLAYMPVFTFNMTKNYWSAQASHFVQDVFKYKDDLKNAAPPGARCIIMNDPTQYVFSYLIDKPGFIFRDDFLPGAWLEDLIKRCGVTYLYSDSRKADTQPEVTQHIEKMVMERGSVRVFKLKEY